MEPLAQIEEVYEEPLTEESPIRMHYSAGPEESARIGQVKDRICAIIDKKRESLGLAEARPINLTLEQAERLRQEIKSDAEWIGCFREVVDVLAPELKTLELSDQLNSIQIPWWNAALLFRERDRYDPRTGLEIDVKMSHSYVTQLMRAGKLPKISQDSASISNVLITNDGLVVLGLRGGHTYSHTIMTVPAGALEYQSGRNPLFETLYAEIFEETGLSREDITIAELEGRVSDKTIGRNSLYVFGSRTKLSFAELLEVWERSIDQREHEYLLAQRDDPQSVLETIRHRNYDPTKANPEKPAVTSLGNVGSILPPCAASLLTRYTKREGIGWGLKAEELLNGAYRFRR